MNSASRSLSRYCFSVCSRWLRDGAAGERQQLVHLERLLEKVLDAQLERLADDLRGAVRGHHHDLRPLGLGHRRRDLADQLEPGHAGHHVVDDEQVERRSPSCRCASRALDGLDDLVALVAQRAAEPLQDLLLVVDEQDRAARPLMRRPPARQRQLDPDLRAFAEPAGHGERAAETFDDVLRDRQAEAGAGPPRGEVRVEDVRHVLGR